MAEFRNFSDLTALYLLEQELLDVRNELLASGTYDPAMSLAENVELLLWLANAFADKYNNLKKERENDKMVARSYPILNVGGIVSNSQPQEAQNPGGDSVIEPGC